MLYSDSEPFSKYLLWSVLAASTAVANFEIVNGAE